MKSNYQAWEIRLQDFEDQKTDIDRLKFLLNFAVLAPSSHNSQPWKFIIKKNNITIKPEFGRALASSDKNHRQLFISIGCALENLLVAADYYNFKAISTYGLGVSTNFQKKSFLSFHHKDHLLFSIPKRRTNRNEYRSQIPDQAFLDRIKSLTQTNIQINFVSEKSKKDAIANIVNKAMMTAMDDKEFRKELSQYVKSNITHSPIGMPGTGLGIPTPVSIIAPIMLRYINMSKLSKKKDDKLLKEHTPLFGIISTSEDREKDWIKTGQLYERIALEAERCNIKTHPLAAAIQIGEFYKELQNILQTAFRPQFFFRLGYYDKIVSPSPRLTAIKLTETI